jgi:hypothetical protein
MLNARFANGRPSHDLSEAGVLVRQFDTLDDVEKPWLPCPLIGYHKCRPKGHESCLSTSEASCDVLHAIDSLCSSWCAKYSDRWATSIINNAARKMYYSTASSAEQRAGVGGLVLSPSVTIFCAYSDGASA